MYSHFITVIKFASLYIMILSENKNYIIEKLAVFHFEVLS